MKLPKVSYRAVAIITIVLSVIGLVLSPVSAATPSAPAGISVGSTAPHHVFNSTQQSARLQMVLANLSQQGIDVSPAQADLAAGNVTAAAQWLMAYHKDHPELAMNGPRQHAFNSTLPHPFDGTKMHAVNATQQTARLQTVFTKLGQQGVDVTQALADLATGNITAAMQDLKTIGRNNPGLAPGVPQQHAFNTTQMTARIQTEVTKLGQQGVDVSQVQADLASGNMSAVMQWMASYHKAHPAQTGNRTVSLGGNNTGWQNENMFRLRHANTGNQTVSHTRSPAQGV